MNAGRNNFSKSVALLVVYFTSLPLAACADPQEKPPTKASMVTKYGFEEIRIKNLNEPIHYYVKGVPSKPGGNLIVYLQGSDPSPQFAYAQTKAGYIGFSYIPRDYQSLGVNDSYVVIEKPGFEGVFPEDIKIIPKKYHVKNSLTDRVMRADSVIRHMVEGHSYSKVIVYGHSEGAPVAAKLATVNSDITHLGFWAGNALPDFFDFALQGRQQVSAGNITDAESQKNISDMMSYFSDVISANPESSEVDQYGYTNKRWFSYSEPPINHLVKLDIPVFVQVATADKSAPIESSYLIPLEFARLGKGNLEYRVCVGCDHGFHKLNGDGENESHWDEIFRSFIDWTSE